MKSIKMLWLLAIAATALMAFAGAASATIVTSPAGTTYTSTIKAVSEGATTLKGNFVTVSCKGSSVEGKIEFHGAAVTAGGKVSNLTFTECNYPTTVNKAGSLEVHTEYSEGRQRTEATGNGTLTSSGAEITIATSIGTCVFTTSGTDIGFLTGSKNTGATATLDVLGAAIPRTGGSFLCGMTGNWNGSYTVTTPDYLDVD